VPRGTENVGIVPATLMPNAPHPSGPSRLTMIAAAYPPAASMVATFSVNVHVPRVATAMYGPPVAGAGGTAASGGVVLVQARPT
jgi:hypothetical protein